MDRDFTDEDYEMLSALDRHGPANARPVSQQALDELPHFTHHVKARLSIFCPVSNPQPCPISKLSIIPIQNPIPI